jgi:dolichyl-phosphate beta-glucosyltransferase
VSAGATKPTLSIIIPAYNEARRLPESIARLQSYFQRHRSLLSEVIVVDDGSTDSTASVVRSWMGRWHALKLVQIAHAGKGAAARAGALAAQGEWVLLSDADFSTPIEEISRFFDEGPSEASIRIGSREATGAQRYGEPFYRHLMGRAFNRLVRMVAVRGIADTQCGFKLIRRDVVLDLFLHQTITGWGFDVELLYIARLRGYGIREIPVNWYYRAGSKVSPLRDTISMAHDLITIRINAARGRYARRVVPHPAFVPDPPAIAQIEGDSPHSAASHIE